MKAFGDVLGDRKAARRARPMRPPSSRLQTEHLSVFEVIAGAKRAHDAMHMAEGTDDAPRRLLAWEREYVPTDDEVAPYLAQVRRFAGKIARRARAEGPRRAGLEFAGASHVQRSAYAQGDDHKPADPMWLDLVVLGALKQFGRPVRAQLPGGKLAARGAWRRAMAQVCRKPPESYARLSGAVLSALSAATKSNTDVRMDSNYCADPGWGSVVLGFANVSHKLHLPGGCACRAR